MKTKILIFLLTSIFLYCGCKNDETPSYPKEPSISLNSFSIINTIDLLGHKVKLLTSKINYTDGDNDFGFDDLWIMDYNSAKYKDLYNLYLELYEIDKTGDLNKIESELNYSFRVPFCPAHQTTQWGPITRKSFSNFKGELEIKIELRPRLYYKGKKYKFSYQIIDQEFNASNIVFSDEFEVLPE